MSDQTIDLEQDDDVQTWARKLDVSPDQVKEAVQAVGPRAADVEQHLKGVRSTTNSERTADAG